MKKTHLIHKCPVIDNEIVSGDVYKMRFKSPEISLHSCPGQFLQIRITKNLDPFLRRPFSISRVDKKQGIIEVLYKVVGRGTELMTRFTKDDLVDVVGPLGNGFEIKGEFSHALIIAGGIGCAPVFFLIDELLAFGKKIKLLFGVKSAEQLIDFNEFNDLLKVTICSEDGSCGTKGLVTDLIRGALEEASDALTYGYACGPNLMYKQIQNINLSTDTSLYWQVSMESNMACGTGVCQGCAIKMKTNDYKLVCSQGPVFNLKDIDING